MPTGPLPRHPWVVPMRHCRCGRALQPPHFPEPPARQASPLQGSRRPSQPAFPQVPPLRLPAAVRPRLSRASPPLAPAASPQQPPSVVSPAAPARRAQPGAAQGALCRATGEDTFSRIFRGREPAPSCLAQGRTLRGILQPSACLPPVSFLPPASPEEVPRQAHSHLLRSRRCPCAPTWPRSSSGHGRRHREYRSAHR